MTDPNAYQVLDDTTAPRLLAVLDGPDALYLLFDEPIQPAAGYDLTTAVSITRQGQPVEGAATRLTANLLEWQPAAGVGGLVPGGNYTINSVHLTDLNGNAATAGATFTHLTTTPDLLLLAYSAPTDSQPEAQSAYGLTTLFQGRTWHPDLGAYYYRARWYLPEAGVFAERDPVGYVQSPSLYAELWIDPLNAIDPQGRIGAFDSFNELPENQEQWRKFTSGELPKTEEERAFEHALGGSIILLSLPIAAVVAEVPSGVILSSTVSGTTGGVTAVLTAPPDQPIDKRVDEVLLSTGGGLVSGALLGTISEWVPGKVVAITSAVSAGTVKALVLRWRGESLKTPESVAEIAGSAALGYVGTRSGYRLAKPEGGLGSNLVAAGVQLIGEVSVVGVMGALPGAADSELARRNELHTSCHAGSSYPGRAVTRRFSLLVQFHVDAVEASQNARPELMSCH